MLCSHPDLPQCKRIQRVTRFKADGLWWGAFTFELERDSYYIFPGEEIREEECGMIEQTG
jgi:hypothetical protein